MAANDQTQRDFEPPTRQLLENYVTPNYGRFPIAFSRGEGAVLWDEEGRRYLDFGTGIAVCSLGHCHPAVVEAVREQAGRLVHTSNLYLQREQSLLARHLVENVVREPGKVFFCNSGAEANETLIKLARKFGQAAPGPSGPPRYEVITFDGSFHGRTMAGISATAQPKAKEGFAPLLEGFRHLPFNDANALESAIGPNTAAILLEPVQGEGGIVPATPDFLRAVAKICREREILLLLDEVQCGLGRVGHVCGWKAILDSPDFVPDAVGWAKGLGGGVPIGAAWIRRRPISGGEQNVDLCDLLGPGSHGSTFGGGPLVSAASLAVLEEIKNGALWQNAAEMGRFLSESIAGWKLPLVENVRGMGLMLGIVLDCGKLPSEPSPAGYVVSKLMENGLLTVPAGASVVRLLPPLNLTREEAAEALEILKSTLTQLET